MTIVDESVVPACAHDPGAFLDDVLETPPSQRSSAALRREVANKRAAAHRRCAACPIFTDCLYRAVAVVNVSGFVACTTERDRRDLRRRLGISVSDAESSFDTARLGGGPVDHAAVLAMRRAHPDDTSQQLANRLGCSTSTVKRHLRRARQGGAAATSATAVAVLPSVDDVLDAFGDLESGRRLMPIG